MKLRLLSLFFLLIFCSAVLADATISLANYLSRANSAGFNIVFSSTLVPADMRVVVGDENNYSIKQIENVLTTFKLRLDQVADGYFVVKRQTEVDQDSIVVPRITPNLAPPEMEEIVVTSSLYRLLMNQTASHAVLDHDDLAVRPDTANDVMRVVNHLPGAASQGISVQPKVRGGNGDETLVMVNGLRVYQPFHFSSFGNLYSAVDSRVVNNMDFRSGGFPVQFGDRMSAVLQINTETAESLGHVREAGLGLYTTSYLQSDGDEDQGYLIDVRRSSIDAFAKLAETNIGEPTFADVYGRFDKTLSGSKKLSLNMLWYGDDISLNNGSLSEVAKADSSSTYLWADLTQDLNEQLTSHSIASITYVKNKRKGQVSRTGEADGDLRDEQHFEIYGLKQAFEYQGSHHQLISVGMDYQYLDAHYDFSSRLLIDPAFSGLSNYMRKPLVNIGKTVDGNRLALFADYKQELWSGFYAELGLRADWQDYISGTTDQFSPRFNFLYQSNNNTEFRLSWGKFSQAEGIEELKIKDGLGQFQSPQETIHQLASIAHSFTSGTKIRIEVYQKNGEDVAAYFENLSNPITLLPELQVDRYLVDPVDFKARGIELTLDGFNDRFSWWFNFTAATSKDHFDQPVANKSNRSWDQKRSANLGISSNWQGWQYSLTTSYHSGWPTTPLVLLADGTVGQSRRNSKRLSNYVSVDSKVMKSWQLHGDQKLRIEAGITNLFNRDNEVGIEYKLKNGQLSARPEYSLPIVPFMDFFWQF